MVTGFVFHTMLVASAFMLVKGNLTIRVLSLIQVINSLLFILLPVATEKWVRSISGSER